MEEKKAVVVKLLVHRAKQPDETASGLYVGKDQQNAYFITAYHVIGPNSSGVPVDAIQLQFHSTPQNFDAFAFGHFDADLDLGVVSTDVSNLPSDLSQVVRKDVDAHVQIDIVGHPSAGNWSVWHGSVQNENAPSDDVHHFSTNRDDSLAGGYSGGPIFDTDGNFLGMHTSTITSYGIAVKSADIVAQLTAWRIPVNNFTTIDAIKETLDHYAHAVNSGDLWNVKAVRLLTSSEEKAMSESLKETKGKGFVLRNCTTPEITRDRARVSCDAMLSGSKQTPPGRITLSMRRIYDRWFIVPPN